MTAVIVTRVDLPLGWATSVAVLAGGVTTLIATLFIERR